MMQRPVSRRPIGRAQINLIDLQVAVDEKGTWLAVALPLAFGLVLVAIVLGVAWLLGALQ